MSGCRVIRAVVLDLDNTLYDWVSAFVPAFYAMVDAACSIGQLDREHLLDDLRRVHQYHGDTEHPFALLECNVVREKFTGFSRHQLVEKFDPAFHKFNSVRKHNLHLYDGVREALVSLAERKIPVLAYSDARIVHCLFRLRRLDIKSYFRGLYSPAQRFSAENGDDFEGDTGFVSILPPEDRKPIRKHSRIFAGALACRRKAFCMLGIVSCAIFIWRSLPRAGPRGLNMGLSTTNLFGLGWYGSLIGQRRMSQPMFGYDLFLQTWSLTLLLINSTRFSRILNLHE